jgi:DNA-binding NtrC family response regulator
MVGLPQMTTAEPQTCLEWVRAGVVDVVVSDLKMPGLDGVSFLERVRQLDPNIRCVLLSGFRPSVNDMRRLQKIHCEVLQKTTDTQRLMRELVANAAAAAEAADLPAIAAMQSRIESLERMHGKWVTDLVAELSLIPKAATAPIAGSSLTVGDLIEEIRALTPEGERCLELWLAAKERLRSGEAHR